MAGITVLGAAAPEIDVQGNGQSILNGDASPTTADGTDFGSVSVGGAPITHTFAISNTGDADLLLTGTPAVTLTYGTAFTVTQPVSTTIDAGVATTFDVTFDPSAAGSFTDTVNIANNDADENPYTFVVSGTGVISTLQYYYLPLIFKNFVAAPDLVIDSLAAGSSADTVTIRNAGTAAVNDAFRVDVYFNPSQTPALNKPWDTIAPAGAVWGVTKSLAPGEVLTLTVGGTYYDASRSSSSFPVGVDVYGYVDSINYDTGYGNVPESNEGNNLFGPVVSTTAAGGPPAAKQGGPVSMEGLPAR